jgi:hypothetical protein
LHLAVVLLFLSAILVPIEWLVRDRSQRSTRRARDESGVRTTRNSSDASQLLPDFRIGGALQGTEGGLRLEIVVHGQYEPTWIAAGEDCVFWTDAFGGDIWKTNLRDHQSSLVVRRADATLALGASADALAWVSDKGVFVFDLRSQAVRRVHESLDTRFAAVAFWRDRLAFSDGVNLWTAPIAGGAARRISNAWQNDDVVGSVYPTFFATPGDGLFWGAQGTLLGSPDPENGFLYTCRVCGPSPGTERRAAGLAVGPRHIVSALQDGTIFRVARLPMSYGFCDPRDGGEHLCRRPARSPAPLDLQPQHSREHAGGPIEALTGDDREVFWAQTSLGGVELNREPFEGGGPTPLARLEGSVAQMVVAEHRLWMTMPHDGALIALVYP